MSVERVYPFIRPSITHRLVVILVAAVPFVLTAFAVYSLWGRAIGVAEVGLLVGGHLLAGIGISLGYHRMLAHRAFRARAPVRFALLLLAINALQGGPAAWAATHRRHHALADREGDPHSPLDGLWHAHFGWLPKGRLVHTGPAVERLMADPIVRFFERTQWFWYVATFLVPGAIGLLFGVPFWSGVLWGGAVRVFLLHHTTWSINSICHVFGTRPHDSPDQARNNGIFGWLAFGEGWHNNHHAFPQSAILGHRWYQVDIGRYLIFFLEKARLIDRVMRPTKTPSGPTP